MAPPPERLDGIVSASPRSRENTSEQPVPKHWTERVSGGCVVVGTRWEPRLARPIARLEHRGNVQPTRAPDLDADYPRMMVRWDRHPAADWERVRFSEALSPPSRRTCSSLKALIRDEAPKAVPPEAGQHLGIWISVPDGRQCGSESRVTSSCFLDLAEECPSMPAEEILKGPSADIGKPAIIGSRVDQLADDRNSSVIGAAHRLVDRLPRPEVVRRFETVSASTTPAQLVVAPVGRRQLFQPHVHEERVRPGDRTGFGGRAATNGGRLGTCEGSPSGWSESPVPSRIL